MNKWKCLQTICLFLQWNFLENLNLTSAFGDPPTTLTIQGFYFLFLNAFPKSAMFRSRWNGCCFPAMTSLFFSKSNHTTSEASFPDQSRRRCCRNAWTPWNLTIGWQGIVICNRQLRGDSSFVFLLKKSTIKDKIRQYVQQQHSSCIYNTEQNLWSLFVCCF